MIRAMNSVTGVNPFQMVNCADLGDVGPNPVDLQDSLARITAFYADLKQVVQISVRGTSYNFDDIEWGEAQGVRIIRIEELFERGIAAVMDEARGIVGNSPTYCSFDIDFVDPTFAPGSGTPEIGGPNSFQAQQVIRALSGVDLVGADLVEVSPPFDPSGGTAWLGVSLMFELMCVLAEAIDRRH